MQPHRVLMSCACWLAITPYTRAGDDLAPPSRVAVSSPNGKVQAEVILEAGDGQGSVPQYRATFNGRPVIRPSGLGIDLVDGSALGKDAMIEGVEKASIRESYTQFPGKRSRVLDHCEEAVISFREKGGQGRRWDLVVRAYDDGFAFRYRFPEQDGWDELAIAGERTQFSLPEPAKAYALPLAGFTTSHEARYETRPVAELPKDRLLGLPLLAEIPGTGWVALTEANLTDYAGMYLAPEGGSALAVRLSPRPDEPQVAVRADLPHESPWRVVMVGDEVGRLVESDLVLSLNAPCAIADTSWIRPGKTTFPWWNGFFEKDVPFKPGLNTATAKYYIDFCAEAGIPYHSLDGLDNIAWYGGTIVPYEGADITKGIDGLDLQKVIRYAAAKGVKIRLWMHWAAVEAHMDRAFPLYREWGIEGVMLDFMDRDDQEMVRFLRRVLEKAAENRLTVTLHGVSQPSGLERTFPNLLTSEAVMNLEYDKWDKVGIPPEHELMIPFTRMLAGPLDFHQGSFRGVPVGEFRPRNEAPLVMGTPCRTLASYVVFQNHLAMVADYPSAYRGHPALPVLAAIPATWDDTRCLAGSVGEYVAIARRHGDEWWIGAMVGREPREAEIPLEFLGDGRFLARIYGDDAQDHSRLDIITTEVTSGSHLRVPIESAGGLLIRLSPVQADRGGEGR